MNYVTDLGLLWIACLVTSCLAFCSDPAYVYEAENYTQFIYSPNWPGNYLDNEDCFFMILAPTDTGRIQVRVVNQSLACCCDDTLLFRDGADGEATAIAEVCSEQLAWSIHSSTNALYVEWKTNGDTTDQGYKLEYSYYEVGESCPDGWWEHNDQCYKYFEVLLLWEDALTQCGFAGGFLASISSEDEDNFLKGQISNLTSGDAPWIGLDDSGVWIDGTELVYSNFPTNFDVPSENCAILNPVENSTWHVNLCAEHEAPFLCKKRKDGLGERFQESDDEQDHDDGSSFKYGWIFGAVTPLFVVAFSCNRRMRWYWYEKCGGRPRANGVDGTNDSRCGQTSCPRQPGATEITSDAGTETNVYSDPNNFVSASYPPPNTTYDNAGFSADYSTQYSDPIPKDLPPPPSYQTNYNS